MVLVSVSVSSHEARTRGMTYYNDFCSLADNLSSDISIRDGKIRKLRRRRAPSGMP